MSFIQAIEETQKGRIITSGEQRNGELEILVIINDAPFVSFPRHNGASSDNYILDNVSVDQILSDDWEEAV